MTRQILIFQFFFISLASIFGQRCYWQQKVDYQMTIDMDVQKNQYHGIQILKYTNNSPDTLHKIFYHLYFNAFQPGSMMDVRSRTIPDPDSRVGDRISKLSKDEIGYQKINSLKINGKGLSHEVSGTILEVDMGQNPILPGQTVTLEMDHDAQVPVQIRRSGRDNSEGIRYSMTQWYPKICEYDDQGWHADPYVGREFYGVWGDFDVTINIDKNYLIGGTGVLENAREIGKGYTKTAIPTKGKTRRWHFVAKNVHDFAWAADPDYDHITRQANDRTTLHFIYQPNDRTTESWKKLPEVMTQALVFMEKHYGQYAYSDYTFIQGGDGGMEYPMATLVTGERSYGALVSVCVHEWMHSWYQAMLGTNEALYPWMDEGFTTFAQTQVMNYLQQKNLIPGEPVENPMEQSILGLESRWAGNDLDEPLSTHSDHYDTNRAYGIAAYTKGSIFLEQLRYIIGVENFDRGMLRYYREWRFKHPKPIDFLRVMEKESGLELDWYLEYWISSTKYPEYAIDSVYDKKIILSKNGRMPMPLEVIVTPKKGKKEVYYIPLRMMRGEKPNGYSKDYKYYPKKDWPWTNPKYTLDIECKASKIKKIEINPSINFVDLNRANNVYPRE